MATETQLSTLKTWLEWAGGRFISLPNKHLKPAGIRIFWPDYSPDIYEVLNIKKTLPVRALAPSSEEIDLMDKILALPASIKPAGAENPRLDEGYRRRRIIWLRLLTNPITQRHKINWYKVAELEHISVYKAQQYHEKGLREIWVRTPDSHLANLEKRFEEISVW